MSSGNGHAMDHGYNFKTKADLHIARKVWHICGVSLIVFLYWSVPRVVALQLITFFAFIFVISDLLRHKIPSLNKFWTKYFNIFMRDYEAQGMAGTSYLMIGSFIIIFLFPRNVVTLSLLFLAFADPIASYVGILYGKDKLIGNKSLQGTIAAFITCTILSCIFFYWQNLMTEQLIIVCIFSGLIGAVSELFPVGNMDDNLTLPIISSALLYGLLYIYGGL